MLGEVNSSSPSFAQITQDMCKVVSDADRAAALPKSSKGTIQRGVAYEVFEREIKELYGEGANGDVDQGNIPRRTVGEITDAVRRLVREVGQGQGKCKLQELEDETDLFGWGVDSLMATRLRARISKVRRVWPSNALKTALCPRVASLMPRSCTPEQAHYQSMSSSSSRPSRSACREHAS